MEKCAIPWESVLKLKTCAKSWERIISCKQIQKTCENEKNGRNGGRG